MPKKRVILAILAVVSLLAFAGMNGYAAMQPAEGAPVLIAHTISDGAVTLDGPWQFHLGDNADFASLDYPDATGQNGWEQLSVQQTWGAQNHPSYVGYAWYRRHVSFDVAPGSNPNLALLIPNIEDVYEIYWNGKLVARNGKMPPWPLYYVNQDAQTFGLGPIRNGVLAFRVWKNPLGSLDLDTLGGFSSPPSVGSLAFIAALKSQLDYARLHSNLFTFAQDVFFSLMTIVCLLGLLQNRSELLLLWMAFLLASQVGNDLVNCGVLSVFPYKFLQAWQQPILSLADIGLWYLLLYLLQLNGNPGLTRFTRNLAISTFIIQCLLGLLLLPDWSDPHLTLVLQITEFAITCLVQVQELFAFVLLWYALKARQKLDFTRWLVAISAFLTFMCLFVVLATQNGYRFTHLQLAKWATTPLFYIHGSGIDFFGLLRLSFLLISLYAVYRYSVQASQQRASLEQEFENARAVQHILVPEAIPSIPGFHIQSVYEPYGKVGGDFFQIIPLPEASVLVCIGDVSGKGMPAAMTVSLLVGILRALTDSTHSPATLLNSMNQHLVDRSRDGFTTCLILRVDADGTVTIANAGHIDPFLDGVEMNCGHGLPLGLTADAVCEETTVKLPLQRQITLMTDGVLEACNSDGELYGFDRMAEISLGTAEGIVQAARQFGQQDDIKVLTLTRVAIRESA